MNNRHGRCLLLVCTLLGLAGLPGCGDALLAVRPGWWPFGGDADFEYLNEQGYLAPSQRVEQLDDLARSAKKKTPEEQDEIVSKLAQEIRGELDPLIRRRMIHTLAEYDRPAAESVVVAALQDPEPEVRIEACHALGRRGGAEASRRLVETLGADTDKDVRLAALRELGDSGDIYAVSAVGKALEDSDPALQHGAVVALEKLTNEDFGDDVNAWLAYVQGEHPEPRQPSLVERIQRALF